MSINPLKFSQSFKIAFLTLMSAIVSGCYDIQGTHYVNYSKDLDRGKYIISMDTDDYSSYVDKNPDDYGLGDLGKFSQPLVSHFKDKTSVFDQSGYAKIEHFYDNFQCTPTPNEKGWSDCTFEIKKEKLDSEAFSQSWSFDWNVVLTKETVLLNSNHHNKEVNKGVPTLNWYFDNDRGSEVDVKFTVRVPNS